jgi:hypothetical protein
MEQIEKLLGKKIIRIETNDLDDMEEVRLHAPCQHVKLTRSQYLPENEESAEVIDLM